MKLAIIHSTPLLDASLSSATLAWLVGGLVAWLVIIVAGVLVTAPARRQSRAAALAKPAETLAPDAPAAAPEPLPAVPMLEPEAPKEAATLPVDAAPETTAPETTAPEAIAPETAAPEAVQIESAPVAAEPAVAAPEPTMSERTPAAFDLEPVHEATDTTTVAATAAEPAQPAAPIPTRPDFSVSGPIMLPNSVVSATFGSATETVSPATGPIIPPPIGVPVRESAVSSSAPASGPLMPAPAPEPEPAAPPAPFVVAPIAPAEPVTPASAPSSANGATYSERVPLPTAVDLFAHSYGRSNAAMLSATERSAATRIVRALGDDPLAVQLASMYAAETHRSLDGLAQLLETDRRNRLEHDGERDALSDADALDVFAGSYGRSNAAMLSATERSAATRIVRALGDDPLAVRLAGQYATETHRSLDRLANRLETDLRHTRGHNGHFGQHYGRQSSAQSATSSGQ